MRIALLLLIILLGQPAVAADATATAITLLKQQRYGPAADAFEAAIKTARPSASLYYQAALANRSAGRSIRALQLFQYVATNFPTAPEAALAKKMLPQVTASADLDLPDIVKRALPKEMQAMLGTEQGKAAMRDALKGQQANIDLVKKAEKQGVLNEKNTSNVTKNMHLNEAVVTAKAANTLPKQRFEQPFTAEDIAKDGAGGIDQSRFPNCWFEASMSALAALPRGQRLISGMIHYGEKDGYVVRFPNDGVEYTVSDACLKESAIQDKALWASILECAETLKFPNNQGASGPNEDQSRLEVGLGCITGCRAEVVQPGTMSTQELSSFIEGAVKSSNPIVCGTFPASHLGGLPDLIVPLHAYTIIGIDSAKGMVMFRNPHGQNADKFELATDPKHDEFEQFDDGVFKMSLPLVQKYFHSVARSFI